MGFCSLLRKDTVSKNEYGAPTKVSSTWMGRLWFEISDHKSAATILMRYYTIKNCKHFKWDAVLKGMQNCKRSKLEVWNEMRNLANYTVNQGVFDQDIIELT